MKGAAKKSNLAKSANLFQLYKCGKGQPVLRDRPFRTLGLQLGTTYLDVRLLRLPTTEPP